MDVLHWDTEAFGEVIRRARDYKGLTQKELAKKCDVSGMYISQIENGERVPRARICRLLAKHLDLDERDLQLKAYLTNAPQEVKDLIENRAPVTYGDEDIRMLFDIILRLPKDEKKHILGALNEILSLVVKGHGLGDSSAKKQAT